MSSSPPQKLNQARSSLQARDLAQLRPSQPSSSCRSRASRWCMSISQFARGDLLCPWPAGRCAVRYCIGADRTGPIWRAQGAGGDGQGTFCGPGCTDGHRIRYGTGLGCNDVVWGIRTARHTRSCHRQAEQDAKCNPNRALSAQAARRCGRRGSGLHARGVRGIHVS